jgi:GT2 family glycosyltransferase
MSSVKIVILSYNHPELTARTVISARKLVLDSQILLVHNGSLPQHQKHLQATFPEIEHLVLPENRHFSGGANQGLAKAFSRSEETAALPSINWVLFLTNDCQLLKLKVPTTPPALIAPLIFARKEGRVDSLGGKFHIQKAHLAHCKSNEEFKVARHPYIPGTAFWIHREVFEKTQGFDESLQTYWEDVDLSRRIQSLGFPLLTDEQTQVLHAIGKTCHKDTLYTTYLYQRNRKRISLKYSRNKLSVYGSLWKSWLITAARLTKQRQWDRLRLLTKAIKD